jgi:hypothetical protein
MTEHKVEVQIPGLDSPIPRRMYIGYEMFMLDDAPEVAQEIFRMFAEQYPDQVQTLKPETHQHILDSPRWFPEPLPVRVYRRKEK